MATDDPIFVDGQAVPFDSSGTDVEPEFRDGQSTVVHEYVATGGTTRPQSVFYGPFAGPFRRAL